MKYIVVLVVALCMSVMPVLGKQVDRTAQPMQGTTVKQVHSESKTVLSDDSDTFHVNSSHTPDHVIGQGGLEMPDSTDKKTTRYSDTDAVNSALQAVVMLVFIPQCTDRRRSPGCREPSCHCAFRKTGSPCTVWKPCSR